MKKRLILIVIFCILIINSVLGDIIINEVMYDPNQCIDSYCEWIELYNNGTIPINLENWTICNKNILAGYVPYNSTNVSLNTTLILEPNSFAIVSDGGISGTQVYDNFNVSNSSIALHVNAGSMCSNGLSNNGEEINLSNGTQIWSFTYSTFNSEGFSAELVNGSWLQSAEYGGTPGRENTAIPTEDNETNITIEGSIETKISISSSVLNLSDILNISGNISSTYQNNLEAIITIKIGTNISGSWKYKWFLVEDYNFTITDFTSFEDIFNNHVSWALPSDLIIGHYKVLATITYFVGNDSKKKLPSEKFFVNGLEDLGEHNLTIVDSPESMGFGDIEKVLVRFDSNNYNFRNLSFVAYIYSPRWASIDLDDNTLRTRPYETNIAMRFENITRGTSLYVAIPILSKRNCDDDYDSGDYTAKVRVYENDENIIEDNFDIRLSGINDAMCPKTKTIYKSGSYTNSPITVDKGNNVDEFRYDDVKFKVSIPRLIGKKFDVNITLENPTSDNKKLYVWSYVYSGRTALMERTANKKEVSIEPNKSINLLLQNTITEENIPIKDYRVMIKANSTNRKTVRTFSRPVDIIMDKAEDSAQIPKIKSFYTRAKKYEKNIKIFSGCEDDDYALILESFDGSQTKKCSKSTYFEVEIKKGTNLFFLSLANNDAVYDTKKLLIIANDTDITSYSESFRIFDMMNTYNYRNSTHNQNLITGMATTDPVLLYESSNEKLKKLIKYLLPALLILLAGIFWTRNKLSQ